jgi:hypothetical protein
MKVTPCGKELDGGNETLLVGASDRTGDETVVVFESGSFQNCPVSGM